MSNDNRYNNLTIEDVRILQGTADKLYAHCVMCNPLPAYYIIESGRGGNRMTYAPTDKGGIMHCILDLRSNLTTFCKLYGLNDGVDLLEKHLRQCADSDCKKCPDTVREIEEYFTGMAEELQEELDKRSCDTG